MWSEPVGEGAKRTRTVTPSSLGILKEMTVTTRRDRRERERTRQQRRRSSGGSPAPRRRIGQGWIVLGVVIAFIALILVARSLGVFDAPAPPIDVNAQQFDTDRTDGRHEGRGP
jgi:cytochrome c-type biogenesis protein CcmH/NrfG